MCSHAEFWVGELARGKLIVAQEHAGHWAVRVALCISLFVLYTLLISTTVVTVHFACCSAKPPLSRSTSFCLFLCIFLPTPLGGGAIEQPCGPFLPATAKLQQSQSQTEVASYFWDIEDTR